MSTIGTIERVWTVGAALCALVWLSVRLLPARFRLPVRSLLVALVISPSVIVGPHEGQRAILPAMFVFVAGIMDRKWDLLLFGFIVPVAFVWAVVYLVSVALIRRHHVANLDEKNVA
jgi:hypothetical protein